MHCCENQRLYVALDCRLSIASSLSPATWLTPWLDVFPAGMVDRLRSHGVVDAFGVQVVTASTPANRSEIQSVTSFQADGDPMLAS